MSFAAQHGLQATPLRSRCSLRGAPEADRWAAHRDSKPSVNSWLFGKSVNLVKTKKTKHTSSQISKSRKATPSASRRLKTKPALLEAMLSERKRLDQALSVFTEAQSIQPGVVGEWSIKDTLAHLTAWEQRLLQRVTGKPEWGADLGTSAFNAQVFRENRNRLLADVQSEYQRSYSAVVKLAEGLSNAEVQQWWSAFAFNTHGHYRWARQNIRQWLRSQSQ